MKNSAETTEPQLLIDGNKGIYIPQLFIKHYGEYLTGITDEDKEILLDGHDNDLYWEAWQEVESNGVLIGNKGERFYIALCDDLWAIPEGEPFPDFL